MLFHKLEDMVYCITSAPWRNEVHFGCDCGCGGDSYTAEQWEEEGRRFDEAIKTLSSMGIVFED